LIKPRTGEPCFCKKAEKLAESRAKLFDSSKTLKEGKSGEEKSRRNPEGGTQASYEVCWEKRVKPETPKTRKFKRWGVTNTKKSTKRERGSK